MKRPTVVLLVAGVVACGSGSRAPSPEATSEWRTILEGLDTTLLSVWGTGPDEVFAVGGSMGNGFASAIHHYKKGTWKTLTTHREDTFWWVTGTSAQDVWFVGDHGKIVHFDGEAFREDPSGTTATLFGVWAATPSHAWAVGGTPEGGTQKPNDVVLHFDGNHWTSVSLPEKVGRAYYKVWGTSPSDVYLVGEAGTIWHKRGDAWTREPNPATGTLLTVTGCGPSEVYAVGGRDVLRSDGSTWTRVSVNLFNDVNGVACAKPGEVVIVGAGGMKQRLTGGTWQDDFGTKPYRDLHGAWADARGGYWAAGGDFFSGAKPGVKRQGVLAHFGASPPQAP